MIVAAPPLLPSPLWGRGVGVRGAGQNPAYRPAGRPLFLVFGGRLLRRIVQHHFIHEQRRVFGVVRLRSLRAVLPETRSWPFMAAWFFSEISTSHLLVAPCAEKSITLRDKAATNAARSISDFHKAPRDIGFERIPAVRGAAAQASPKKSTEIRGIPRILNALFGNCRAYPGYFSFLSICSATNFIPASLK